MRALLPLLALLAGCGGCASVPEVPTHDELRNLAVRLEAGDSVCGGTRSGPRSIRTAAHCVKPGPIIVDGTMVAVVGVRKTATDAVDLSIAGLVFDTWAKEGPALREGDRVRWWGQPHGEPLVYREGYVAKAGKEAIFIDAPICHGDSGSGLFDSMGRLVGVVSAMTNMAGCTFMVTFPRADA